jgi:pimeloyl-ACP methyl ester carboxylesterase
MHYVAAGSGAPPVLLVHGVGCSHADWRAQVAHLPRRHAVIAVDLPAHGGTPAGAETAGIEQCAGRLVDRAVAQPTPPRPRRPT